MTHTYQLQGPFTSQQAVDLFREHTGFEFHPTVPGTLLAGAGIQKIPSISRPSAYDAEHWALVWDLMMDLAHQRCRYDRELQRPTKRAAPSLPLAMPTETALSRQETITADRHPPALAKPKIASALRRHPTRRFIEVPFQEKDAAKMLGALWEPTVRKWYVPAGINRKLFRWADALLPPAMCAVRFPSDKLPKKPRQKKIPSADRSTISNKQIHKALDDRLNFLLEKPD